MLPSFVNENTKFWEVPLFLSEVLPTVHPLPINETGLLKTTINKKLQEIYNIIPPSAHFSHPTVFDIFCDLDQRGALFDRSVFANIKLAIDTLYQNRDNYAVKEKFTQTYINQFCTWAVNFKSGLYYCSSTRKTLIDEINRKNKFSNQFMEKAYQLESKNYGLRELAEHYSTKCSVPKFTCPSLDNSFTYLRFSTQGVIELINRVKEHSSIELPKKEVFFADFRINLNLEHARTSSGERRLSALINAFNLGHHPAALDIARHYLDCTDYIQAARWLVIALQTDLRGEASYIIASILESRNSEMADEYFKKSADYGYTKSCLKIAKKFVTTGKTKEALKWYSKAANQNDPEALYIVGNYYFYGFGDVDRDLNKTFEAYSKASDKGVTPAIYCLGRMYLQGLGVQQSDSMAERYFNKISGHPGADYALAEMHSNNAGEDKWVHQKLLDSGLKGNSQALNKLGQLYETTLFVASSVANFLFLNSALMGNANALTNLVLLWNKGTLVSFIPFDSDAFLKTAMDQGDPDAMVYYANGCLQPSERLAFYRQAAKKGSLEAYCQLGEMYLNGREVEQSYEKAVVFFSAAAKRGHAGATYNLAQCYQHGLGVPASRAIAQKLYARAGQMGHWDAKLVSWCMTLDDCGSELFQALENAERRINIMLERDK